MEVMTRVTGSGSETFNKLLWAEDDTEAHVQVGIGHFCPRAAHIMVKVAFTNQSYRGLHNSARCLPVVLSVYGPRLIHIMSVTAD